MLIMLTLPLQAWASVTMLDCQHSRAPVQESMAMAGETMANCHSPDKPDAPSTRHNCKHCAACVLASMLPVAAAEPLALRPLSTHFVPQPAESFSGFIPDGPERPPRTSLA